MIEHELHVRAAVDECGRIGELVGPHAQVEGEPDGREPPDVRREPVVERGTPGRLLKDATDAVHVIHRGEPLVLGRELGALRSRGGDRTDHPRVHVADELGLGHHVRLGDVDLHVQGRGDPERYGLGEVGLGRPGAVDGGRPGEPGVGEALRVDEMQVGVDDAHAAPLRCRGLTQR